MVFNAALALIPVVLFLGVLILLDTFKLAHPATIVNALLWGVVAAFLSSVAYDAIIHTGAISAESLTLYAAPCFEDTLKALFVAYLLVQRRIGFPVDAAVLGFAVGCGFALVENVHFLLSLSSASPTLWFVRGLGTAVLHGATTAIFAMMAKTSVDRRGVGSVVAYLPGLMIAIALHSAFNHVLLPPVAMTGLLLLVLPLIVLAVFQRSERATREWIGAGLDLDIELLRLVTSEDFAYTRFGKYLNELRNRFPAHVVVNMFCLLRIELELAVQAKALLLVRDAGADIPVHPDAFAAMDEVQYLRKSIGRTGLLALRPLHVTTDRDAWHKYLLVRARSDQ